MKIKFIGALLITLVIGGSLGYIIGAGKATTLSSGESASGGVAARAPRFADNARFGRTAPGGKEGEVYSSRSSMDSLLLKYSQMTPEQLQAEIKALSKMDLVGRQPDIKKMMSFVYLSYKWGQVAPKQALLEANSLGMLRALAEPMILQGWAENDPESAAAYLIENKKRMQHGSHMLSMVAVEMGKSSPEKAMSWVSTLDEKDKNRALSSVISGIADEHPDQLKANIGKLTEEDLKNNDLVSQIARKWAVSNWEEASEWLKILPEDTQKTAKTNALVGLASSDLKKATEEFRTLSEEEQGGVASSIAGNLSFKGGTEALEWLVDNASEKVAAEAASSAINYNSSYEQREQMRDYILSLPAGEVKDSSLESMIQRNAYAYDGDSADYKNNVELAMTIGDEKKRDDTTSTVLRRWVDQDPAAAKAWVENSSLNQDLKDRYTKRADEKLKENE